MIYSSMASPNLVVQVFASVAFNPFLPAFSLAYQQGDLKRFRSMFHKSLAVLAGMCLVVTLGAVILGRPGLRLLFGPDILEHYGLFLPIVWCTIFTAVIWIISAILIALRKIGFLVAGMAVDFVLCLLLAEPLIERYNKNGVSLVQIIVMGLYILFMIIGCELSARKSRIKKASGEG